MKQSKKSVRTLTALALLIALSIVFARVLSISTGFVRFVTREGALFLTSSPERFLFTKGGQLI